MMISLGETFLYSRLGAGGRELTLPKLSLPKLNLPSVVQQSVDVFCGDRPWIVNGLGGDLVGDCSKGFRPDPKAGRAAQAASGWISPFGSLPSSRNRPSFFIVGSSVTEYRKALSRVVFLCECHSQPGTVNTSL